MTLLVGYTRGWRFGSSKFRAVCLGDQGQYSLVVIPVATGISLDSKLDLWVKPEDDAFGRLHPKMTLFEEAPRWSRRKRISRVVTEWFNGYELGSCSLQEPH